MNNLKQLDKLKIFAKQYLMSIRVGKYFSKTINYYVIQNATNA